MERGDDKKKDHGKPMWDLLPWKQVGYVVDVLTEAVKEKYKPHSWKEVPGARERYFAASQRHILAWWHGERLDPDDNLPHLAHAACCLLFLMWFDDEHEPNDNKKIDT